MKVFAELRVLDHEVDDGDFVCQEVSYNQGVSSAEFVLHGQVERNNGGFLCLAEKFYFDQFVNVR